MSTSRIPYDLARAVYEGEPCARTFAEDLELHLRHGYVVSTPQAFALVRPVWRHWDYARLADPAQVAAEGDCWWIWLLSGHLRTALAWLPEPRSWIGYERQNVPRFFPSHRFPLRGPDLASPAP